MPFFRVAHALDELFIRDKGLVKVTFKGKRIPHVDVLVIVCGNAFGVMVLDQTHSLL
jgi:hypothetical protein